MFGRQRLIFSLSFLLALISQPKPASAHQQGGNESVDSGVIVSQPGDLRGGAPRGMATTQTARITTTYVPPTVPVVIPTEPPPRPMPPAGPTLTQFRTPDLTQNNLFFRNAEEYNHFLEIVRVADATDSGAGNARLAARLGMMTNAQLAAVQRGLRQKERDGTLTPDEQRLQSYLRTRNSDPAWRAVQQHNREYNALLRQAFARGGVNEDVLARLNAKTSDENMRVFIAAHSGPGATNAQLRLVGQNILARYGTTINGRRVLDPAAVAANPALRDLLPRLVGIPGSGFTREIAEAALRPPPAEPEPATPTERPSLRPSNLPQFAGVPSTDTREVR